MLRRILCHPLARALNVDSAEAIEVHRQMLASKKLLRLVYHDWYGQLQKVLEPTAHLSELPMIEVGAGTSELERYVPGVIKSDYVPNSGCALQLDAQALPFADGSLRAIFVSAVLHHIHEPERFLREAERCLAKGGRVVLMEPRYNFISSFLTRMFHPYEFYDPEVKDWKNSGNGRMSDANCALPWVIFVRDRMRFEREFPRFKIAECSLHTIIAYYLSGGMTYRSFIPDSLAEIYLLCEKWLARLVPPLCVQMTVQLEKL